MIERLPVVARLVSCAARHYTRRKFLFSSAKAQTRQLTSSSQLADILAHVRDGKLCPLEASNLLVGGTGIDENDAVLQSFANLDHERSKRTGFPEAVFAEGKTSDQVAHILDDMARRVNESILLLPAPSHSLHSSRNAILATRYVLHRHFCAKP
jgi:hypothetical protein